MPVSDPKYLDILFGAALSLGVALIAFFLNWWKENRSKEKDEKYKHLAALKAVMHEIGQMAIQIKVQGKLMENIQEEPVGVAYPIALPIRLSTDKWKANVSSLDVGEDLAILYLVYSHVDAVNEMGKIATHSSPEVRALVSEQQIEYVTKNIYPAIKPAMDAMKKHVNALESK